MIIFDSVATGGQKRSNDLKFRAALKIWDLIFLHFQLPICNMWIPILALVLHRECCNTYIGFIFRK